MADERPVEYGSYLALDELLRLQHTRSTHRDELLFIVVHQASELWFKVILHELDGLIDAMQRGDSGMALWSTTRVNTLVRIVTAQLSSLETLPPQHFAEFRGYLGTSSGSQSVQFRAIEAVSGRREDHFLQILAEHGEIHPQIRAALDKPTLESMFFGLLEREDKSLESLYTGPGPTTLFFLAESLLEYEQQFARWRFLHVQLVERVIGPGTSGTGGTLGAKYLQRTVSQKFFPRLWEGRAAFFGGPAAP